MSDTRMPTTTTGWGIWLWGVTGVLLILGQAVIRLGPRALSVVDLDLSAGQIALTVLWTGFMIYTEAYRGFHKQFSPRVVVRAAGVANAARPWHVLFAPIVAMGLVYGTRRRLLVSRLLLLGIIVLILGVRALPEPWRAMVDVGVVIGLVLGMLSVAWLAARAALGAPPDVPAEFPEPG